ITLGPRRIPSTISPTIVGCRNRLIVKWLKVARTRRIVSCWYRASVPAIAGLKRAEPIKSLTEHDSSPTKGGRSHETLEGLRGSARFRSRLLSPLCPIAARFVLGHDDAEVQDAVVRVWVVPDTPALRQNLVELDFHGPETAEDAARLSNSTAWFSDAIGDNDFTLRIRHPR